MSEALRRAREIRERSEPEFPSGRANQFAERLTF